MYGHYQQPPSGPSTAPIPAPVPKAAYAAPVFQTFQDRKRAKEAALRANIEPSHPHFFPPSSSGPPLPPPRGPSHSPSLPSIHQNPARPLPQPLPRIRSSIDVSIPPPITPPILVDSPASTPIEKRQSPIEATLERSDTLASIRSLDRLDFSSTRRPLPKPPTNVNSSRSLDRGIQSRRKPSDIEEEDERSPAKFSPLPSIEVPEISLPSINVPEIDIPSINVPEINLPEIDEPSSSPGIVVTAIPTISVTTDAPSPIRLHADSAIICAGCGESIIGRIVNAMKRRFHPHCFTCSECKENLEHVSSYEWEGKAYCHLDYHDKFAHQCHHCKTPIVDPRFVTLNDDLLGQRYYHELHFFCSECGDPFLDPSKAGGSAEDETNAFTIHRGHPYCERCHLRLHKPKCKGCKKPIPDVAVNAMGSKWHKECFVCDACGNQLNNLFFPKDGKSYCTACWEDV